MRRPATAAIAVKLQVHNCSLVLAAVLGLDVLASAQPILSSMEPRGGQAGSAVRLVLKGERLGPRATLDLGASPSLAATPLAAQAAGGQLDTGQLAYLLEIGADAANGVYPLRVETEEGISNALLFSIGAYPSAVEAESQPEGEGTANDFRPVAQPLELPVTVEGRLQGPERDIFRIRAEKGQSIVGEVAARRIGSAIDPNLELMDAKGLVRARSADSLGLGLDARISYVAAESGDYYLTVRDERYSEQSENFYRLTVGEYRYADTVYPLGWTRNSQVEAEFSGGNLDEPIKAPVDLAAIAPNATSAWVPVPGSPSSVSFETSSGPEQMETEAAGVLSDGVVVNGRIGADGELDSYRLKVDDGEEWAFELRSGELQGSELYGVLTISHKSDTLAVAGRHAGDPNPYVISTTGQTASYPFVNLAVPPGVDELRVSVEDLLGRGGPGFAYRLVARRQGPDFLLTLVEPFRNIPAGGSAVVTVRAERRGYFGPIQLYVEDPPPELNVSGGHIPPASRLNNTFDRFVNGQLTLSPDPDAKPRRLNLVIRGRATGENTDLDRRAAGPGIVVPVRGPDQSPVTAAWLGADLPVRITPQQAARLEFLSERRVRLVKGGGTLSARWAISELRPGARITREVDIPRNAGSLRLRKMDGWDGAKGGEFGIFAHERTSLGTVNLSLRAGVEGAGRKEEIISRPLVVEIVEGYGISPLEAPLKISAGGEATLEGTIWRDDRFRRTVSVSAVGLPPEIRCEASDLVNDQVGFELHCSADPDAPVGMHEIEVKAESVLSDEGTTPYPAEPAKARLAISL